MIRRLGAGLAVLWAAATASYAALLLAPPETPSTSWSATAPTPRRSGPGSSRNGGLDRPEIVQYLSYLWRLLHGDLGRSYQQQRGVGEILA
ncbi:hypothetical protein ACFSTC_39600 [Nonomuraea ferruginea]